MNTIAAVIPVFNGARFVTDCLDSVAAQTLPCSEIIVIDDGSTDSSSKVIHQWAQSNPTYRVIYRYQDNGGVSQARNTGWSMATSIWIAFLDVDDVWHPDHNKALLAAAEACPEASFVFGDSSKGVGTQHLECDPGTSSFRNAGVHIDDGAGQAVTDKMIQKLALGSFVATCATLCKKELLEMTGGFNLQFSAGEDRLMWLSLATLGTAAYTSQCVARIRYHEFNATHSKHSFRNTIHHIRLAQHLIDQAQNFHLSAETLGKLNVMMLKKTQYLDYLAVRQGLQTMKMWEQQGLSNFKIRPHHLVLSGLYHIYDRLNRMFKHRSH